MHFTTLFVLKKEELENLSEYAIEEEFSKRFCYCCNETTPKYRYWCDWFQIGGRWSDILHAKKGIRCARGWSNDNAPIVNGVYSIVNIRDLTKPIDRSQIYAVATKSKIYQKTNEWTGGIASPNKFDSLLNQIDNKEFDGVIALIDCHD